MISLSQSAFLQALGWAIANSLWQMALLWGLYQLCFGLFPAVKASVKTTAATILLFAGFLWFLGTLVNHYWNLTADSGLGNNPALVGYTTSLRDYPGHTFLFYVNKALGWSEHYLPYLSSAYLLVLAFLLLRVVKAYRQVREIRTEGLTKIEARWRVYVQEMAYRIGIPKNIKVWLSDRIDIPATVGYLKPLILLPIATFNHLTTEQVEAILLHELAHINRNDYLLNLVITVVETILFFNPFAQLISRHIKTERENSCDDFVLQFRYNPHAYASALLSLEQQRSAPELVMAASGSTDLLDRVKRIMNVPSSGSINYGQKLMALLIIACILVSLAWLTPETIVPKTAVANPIIPFAPADRTAFIDTVSHVYAKGHAVHRRALASPLAHPRLAPVIVEDIHADLPASDNQEITVDKVISDSVAKACATVVTKLDLIKLQWAKSFTRADYPHYVIDSARTRMLKMISFQEDPDEIVDLDGPRPPVGSQRTLKKGTIRYKKRLEPPTADFGEKEWKSVPMSFCVPTASVNGFKERVVLVRSFKKMETDLRNQENNIPDISCSSADNLLQQLEGDGKVNPRGYARIEKDNNILIINGKVQDESVYSRYSSYLQGRSVLIVTSGKIVQITIK